MFWNLISTFASNKCETYLSRYILIHEGIRGMFKGLGPNIMGVAPTRAIYFWSYNTCKKKIDASVPKANRDTSLVHVVSAAAAGKYFIHFLLIKCQDHDSD